MSTQDEQTGPAIDAAPHPGVWPCLTYIDAPAGVRWLVDVLGFTEVVTYPGETEGTIAHAELRWPDHGGVMLGSAGEGDGAFATEPGSAVVYLSTDEVDAVHERAVSAGARVVSELTDKDYGSRDFAVADPEGNRWSIGTYRGAPIDG